MFTAGGDGVINLWDYEVRNKIRALTFNKVPITFAKISPDGNYMAYALGYDWSEGIWGLE